MDATTFADPNIVAYMNQNFYAVKFDAETRDTIVFNNHTFVNTDPTFVKKSAKCKRTYTLVCAIPLRKSVILPFLCYA